MFAARNCSVQPDLINKTLRETLQEVIPAKQEQLRKLVRILLCLYCLLSHPSIQKLEHGQSVVGDVKVLYSMLCFRNTEQTKVENIIGGMRGLKAMLWEASVLDPVEVR